MEKFDQIQRQLWQTFIELKDARGKNRRSCLRRARLLLLLADEMLSVSDDEDLACGSPAAALAVLAVPTPEQPKSDLYSRDDEASRAQPSGIDAVGDVRTLLQVLADNAAGPAKAGSCQGLQSVLVLRCSGRPRTAPTPNSPRLYIDKT